MKRKRTGKGKLSHPFLPEASRSMPLYLKQTRIFIVRLDFLLVDYFSSRIVCKLSLFFYLLTFPTPFPQGQREPTLSRLLAGGHEDEITEWSESMATPPLNTTEPAGGRRNPFMVLMIDVETAFQNVTLRRELARWIRLAVEHLHPLCFSAVQKPFRYLCRRFSSGECIFLLIT